jgi:hypothetical protein
MPDCEVLSGLCRALGLIRMGDIKPLGFAPAWLHRRNWLRCERNIANRTATVVAPGSRCEVLLAIDENLLQGRLTCSMPLPREAPRGRHWPDVSE